MDEITFQTRKRYAMTNDSAGAWGQPGAIGDSLTDVLRRGARDLIEQAVEAELKLNRPGNFGGCWV
jgi:hypothetical protein